MSQNELQRLNPRHYEIINLALAGYSVKDIAMAVSMTPQAISLITKSPLFQDELARRRENQEKIIDTEMATGPAEARKILDNAVALAASVHVGALVDPDVKVRQTSATEIMNRVLGKNNEAGSVPTIIINADTINLLSATLKESQAGRAAIVVDAEKEVA